MNEPLAQRLRPKTLAEVCGQHVPARHAAKHAKKHSLFIDATSQCRKKGQDLS